MGEGYIHACIDVFSSSLRVPSCDALVTVETSFEVPEEPIEEPTEEPSRVARDQFDLSKFT